MIKTYFALKKFGILGINNRIGRYILKSNPRSLYPLVDNKILTAQYCEKYNILTPTNYFIIENYGSLKKIQQKLEKLDSFVIKPAKGSQGNGIIVIKKVFFENDEIFFERSNSKIMNLEEIKYHISGILSGLYSLAGQSDAAIIQERILKHPIFEKYSYEGIPDIRVIVYQGFPIMSMVRLPTKQSDGRANLHHGAIGVGLDIRSGQALNAVLANNVVTTHPDTGEDIRSLIMPMWKEILLLSAKCFEMVKLGYLGADIILTPDKGPMLLELNARPGLAIQIANLSGLVPRLEKIRLNAPQNLDTKQRVEYSINEIDR